MPHYIFTLADDQDDWDGEAEELPDVQAAKCVAIRMISETLCNHPQKFWETDTHQVTVSDEKMLTQFIVEIVTTTAPALKPPTPLGL
jgi:hypothetical protein